MAVDFVDGIDARQFSTYLKENRPVVVRNFAADWPACNTWSFEYLKNILGNREVEVEYNKRGIFNFNQDACTGGVTVACMPFSKAADCLAGSLVPDVGAYYIREMPMMREYPDLVRDLRPIKLVRGINFHVTPRIWIAGANAGSPLHYDGGDENFLVHIFGTKQFVLFSPDQTAYMYPNVSGRLPHLSMVNAIEPDLEQFPLFANARPETFVLQPRDLLYVPKNWWHATISPEPSISVNFWWRSAWHLIKSVFSNR